MLKRCLSLFVKYYNPLFLFSLPLFILYFILIYQFPTVTSPTGETPLTGSLLFVLVLLLFLRFFITFFAFRFVWHQIQDEIQSNKESFLKTVFRLLRFFINFLPILLATLIWFSLTSILGILFFIPSFPWNSPSIVLWTQTIQKAGESVNLGFSWFFLLSTILWILFLLIPWFLSQINIAVQKNASIPTSWKKGYTLAKGNRIKICFYYLQIACLELLLFLVFYTIAFGFAYWINGLRGITTSGVGSTTMQMTSILSGLITFPLEFAAHLALFKTLTEPV